MSRFIRYSVTVGATGLFTGLAFHHWSKKRPLVISAAKDVNLNIQDVISKDLQLYAKSYAPVMKHGFPSFDTLRHKGNFVLSYDRRNRVANWVMEHLTPDMIEAEKCTRREFYEDDTIHDYFKSTNEDYANSGYDRGHLAAAANHKRSQREYDQTFVYSNAAPQDWYFNQRIWETLENHVRNLVKEHRSVYVCTGPLYLPRELTPEQEEILFPGCSYKKRKRKGKQFSCASEPRPRKYIIYEVIGKNDVAVPTHFFKIILWKVKGKDFYDMEAYVIPNQPINQSKCFKDFKAPKDAIERAAGFLVFNQLPSEAIRSVNGKVSDSSESDDNFSVSSDDDDS